MELHEEQKQCAAEEVDLLVQERTTGQIVPVVVEKCPFEGLVEVRHHRGQTDWDCPLCLTKHEAEVDHDGDWEGDRDR